MFAFINNTGKERGDQSLKDFSPDTFLSWERILGRRI
jgi:hypothetical protein